ncbi:hypothetical protein BH11MYX1_BH11MYX1_25120 [soil metagenome]
MRRFERPGIPGDFLEEADIERLRGALDNVIVTDQRVVDHAGEQRYVVEYD